MAAIPRKLTLGAFLPAPGHHVAAWRHPDACPDGGLDLPGVTTVRMPAEPSGYAAQFYATLHALDAAGLDRIVVDLPPDREEWLAIRDRLRRASAPP